MALILLCDIPAEYISAMRATNSNGVLLIYFSPDLVEAQPNERRNDEADDGKRDDEKWPKTGLHDDRRQHPEEDGHQNPPG